MTIDELKARQDEIKAELRSLDEENRGQELPPEARDKWDRLEEEYESNETKLSELIFRRDRVEALAGKKENREEPTGSLQVQRAGATRGEDIWDLSTVRASVSGPEEATRELRDRAMRAIERATFAHPDADQDAARTHIERLAEELDGKDGSISRYILQTGSPTYRSAFIKAMSGSGTSLTPEEQRALSIGAGEKGGFLLPYTLDPSVVPVSNGSRNPLRSISRVVQTQTNEWKGVTSGGMTAAYREAEGEETTDDSPTFAQPEIVCHAADAFAQWTFEFGQDYGSINAELARMVQVAKDDLEAAKLSNGSGEKEPFGVLTGATEVVETAEAGKFGVGDLYTLEETLADTRFGVNAKFVGKRAIYNRTRQFDTAGGANLWIRLGEGFARRDDGALGEGLLGYLTYELSTMPGVLTVKEGEVNVGQKILLFGDFDYYVIADRIGTMAKPVDNVPGENGRPTGQQGLYFFWRNGAKVLSKAAFRVLKVK